MNAIIMIMAVVAVGIVLVGAVAIVVKKTLRDTQVLAGLRDEARDEIVKMKGFLETMRKERAEERAELARREGRFEKQIEGLGQQADALGASTAGLEKALRGDAQLMGSWAELQLRKVLEISGLTENVSYTYQETLASEDSNRRNLRTDVQVKLPNDKVIVIDSKNTVPSYLDYNAATDEEGRERGAARIIESVKNHISEIVAANYQKNIKNCFPKVIMYFPFEIPYLLACQAEVKVGNEKRLLREVAYENDIIFATASNLLPILKGVAMVWAERNVDKKVKRFIDDADKLCAKMNTFLATYQKIGKLLGEIGKEYRVGMGQLAEGKGNVVKKLAELSEANVESACKLPAEDGIVEHANKVVAETTVG